ncbi:putative disease resistance protein RGA3 [Chenopodium quinoa]|uniref:putative disease resistance protein RGA3 n=1 Tax=Chenopodium quinoa TaxID=63459 RepID=UPI000B7862FE|nr:putative disease resistance protein RGA3 [Chenopodium quinoa]XP_021736967.1 putative disease resistance protein RGA3 [Chenopodium quinoa]XP_021736968.1 putative disease resistance protein RGA3 [Chenopodium quinoa]
MNELDDVAACMLSLNLRVHAIENQPAANLTKTRETQSFVLKAEVIGRYDDKMAIIERIMNSDDVEGNVSVIPIVGIGGLGKTTLAQLVFNDENVQKHFELNSWACISEISCLEELVSKILKSIVEEDYRHLSLQQLQSRLREAINGKKYLFVLDDIWDEDRERWLPLKSFLCGCKRGSTIIITTRSRVVAENMGTVQPYELGGLPEGQSWKLFRNLAFKEGQEERDPHLTIIGKEIVKKCANVPLTIRTIAGLLYSQDTVQEWESFRDAELRTMEQQENSVTSTLKLSYIHLTPQLQQCFAYCKLFPKDYEINKQNLIYC